MKQTGDLKERMGKRQEKRKEKGLEASPGAMVCVWRGGRSLLCRTSHRTLGPEETIRRDSVWTDDSKELWENVALGPGLECSEIEESLKAIVID